MKIPHRNPANQPPIRMADGPAAKQNGDGAFEQGPQDEAGGDALTHTPHDELEELRRLLLAPEQDNLAEFSDRLVTLETRGVDAEAVAEVLPEAIALQTKEDRRLAQALAPTIQESMRVSIQRDPQPFADALFPIIGPAIRKSIREAFRSMLEQVNQVVNTQLSLEALRWRLEARRTGLSYSEVVLRHTLLYRVEQVFLIDEEAGLPLLHVVAEDVDAQDSSLVSSMLTALEDFAQDSFGTAEDETLDAMEIGDLTVWLAQGPEANVAAVIRGLPAPEVRDALEDVVATIHLQYKDELEAFDGDAEPLEGAKPLLESVLLSQYAEKQRRTSPVLWGVLALVVVALGAWLFFAIQGQLRWNDYLARLAAEPGLVVTEQGRTGGGWYVQGLRDPLAKDPAAILAETPISPADVRGRWAFYQTLDSAFVVRRAVRLLEAPPSVSLAYEAGTLTATGRATGVWLAEARQRARFIPGVDAYDDSGVEDEFQDVIAALERQALRFVGGGARLAAGQEAALDSLIAAVQRFQATAEVTGRRVRLRVLGHASTEGSPAANQFLSRQRAESVRTVLIQRGLPPEMVVAEGTGRPRFEGEETTEEQRAANRSVSFRVVVN